MTVKTGRLGWVGVSLETTAGAPVPPADYLPFIDCSLIEKQSVLADVSVRGTRDAQPENSQLGRQWGEGSLKVNMDATLAPYLFIGAQGAVNSASQGSGVYLHTITRVNSNTPNSLSVIFDRVTDRQLFPYSVVNTLEMAYSDGFAEITANLMSRFPSTSTSGTLTTTSGTYYAFRHAVVQVSDTIANAANSATPLKLRSFNVSIANNTELQFVSGNRNADSIIQRNYEVTGTFRLAFENTTQRDDFNNLVKQAMIITFTGNGIGGGLNEFVKFKFYKLRINDYKVTVPADEFVSEEISFVGEYSSADTASLDILVQNRKASY